MQDIIFQLVDQLRHRMERCSERFTGNECPVCKADAEVIDLALHPAGNVAIHYVPMKVHVDLCLRCEKDDCCVSQSARF
jgi:hypothetical protein